MRNPAELYGRHGKQKSRLNRDQQWYDVHVKVRDISDLDLTVLELLFSPDPVVAASNSSGGLGKSLNVPF